MAARCAIAGHAHRQQQGTSVLQPTHSLTAETSVLHQVLSACCPLTRLPHSCLPGMEDGGICCWDLEEPDKAHRAAAQQQQQQPTQQLAGSPSSCKLPARRPSYSTDLPQLLASVSSSSGGTYTAAASSSSSSSGGGHQREAPLPTTWAEPDAGLSVGGVVGLAVVPSTPSGASGAAADRGSGGGPVCRLVVLGSGACVTLYSVMVGDAGNDVAVADLGMRSGEWRAVGWLCPTAAGQWKCGGWGPRHGRHSNRAWCAGCEEGSTAHPACCTNQDRQTAPCCT